MKFYDLHVKAEGSLEEIVKTAKLLGWDGISLVTKWKNEKALENFKLEIEPFKKYIDIAVGVEIKSTYAVKKIVRKIRKEVELILVQGGNIEINRAILQIPEVDILTNQNTLDYVLANLAAKNNVAIEFAFRDLLYSYEQSMVAILAKFLKNAKLVRKYHTPFIITSNPRSNWDLRSPSELISFGKILGFNPKVIKQAISDKIVKENRKRLNKKWIMPGVEIE